MAKKKTSLAEAAKKLTDKEKASDASKSGTKSSSSSGRSGGTSSSGKTASKSSSAKGTTKNSGSKSTAGKSSSSKSSSSKGSGSKSTGSSRSKSSGTKSSGGKSSTAKGSSKKSSSGESNAPAKKPAQSAERKQILTEINEIAEDLDDAGLALLLEQAQVVRYKGQIEEFNRQLNTAATKAAKARREASRPDYSVAIERNEDDFFIIQMDSARIFFNIQEMREITRICHRAKNEYAGARFLFRWFEQERGDLLVDTGINSERSPYLYELYDLIINTYKVKS